MHPLLSALRARSAHCSRRQCSLTARTPLRAAPVHDRGHRPPAASAGRRSRSGRLRNHAGPSGGSSSTSDATTRRGSRSTTTRTLMVRDRHDDVPASGRRSAHRARLPGGGRQASAAASSTATSTLQVPLAVGWWAIGHMAGSRARRRCRPRHAARPDQRRQLHLCHQVRGAADTSQRRPAIVSVRPRLVDVCHRHGPAACTTAGSSGCRSTCSASTPPARASRTRSTGSPTP